MAEHRYDEALMAHDRALEVAPGNSGFAVNRAMVLLALGRIEQALPELERARPALPGLPPGIDPSIRDAYVERGGRKLDAGDPSAALADFQETRRRDSAHAMGWSEEAVAFSEMREWVAMRGDVERGHSPRGRSRRGARDAGGLPRAPGQGG